MAGRRYTTPVSGEDRTSGVPIAEHGVDPPKHLQRLEGYAENSYEVHERRVSEHQELGKRALHSRGGDLNRVMRLSYGALPRFLESSPATLLQIRAARLSKPPLIKSKL